MTEKTPIEIVCEGFSLADATRVALGERMIEGLDSKSAVAQLKQELIYAENQAKNGPEKSRHIFAKQAEKLKAELKRKEDEALIDHSSDPKSAIKPKPKAIAEEEIDFKKLFHL
jgi:hypothetical protein